MKHAVICLVLTMGLTACGVGTMSVPADLSASGFLGQITLSWSVENEDGISGFNVYRGTDGESFELLVEAESRSHVDFIPSPAGDGVIYFYRVTSVGEDGSESEPSGIVSQMHGTRLPGVGVGDGTPYHLGNGGSPFVVEGTVTFLRDLYVDAGALLCFLPGSTLRMATPQGASGHPTLSCSGTLRAVGMAADPVKITCTQADGSPPFGQNAFTLQLASSEPWDPVSCTGTVMMYVSVENASRVDVTGTGALISNCRFSPSSFPGSLTISGNPGPTVSHCRFEGFPPDISSDMRGSGFSFTSNTIVRGSSSYVMYFRTAVGQVLSSGQVSQNDFDGPSDIYIFDNTAAVAIPLGGNYWRSGTPTVHLGAGGVVASIDFATPLSTAPDGAGPGW